MKREILCFGVRKYEIPTFNELGKAYKYDLILKSDLLTNENIFEAYGAEIIMIRGNCFLNAESINKLKSHGLKYILTRTIGYNHIDISACKDLGIKVAYAPGYSPNAISELALTLAMMLLRNISYATNQTHNLDFRVTDQMHSKEVRNCTVGIIGCGRIGVTTAKYFSGLGANVIGYDVYQSSLAKQALKFADLDTVLKESDIISIHVTYIKGANDNLVDREFISKMKDGAILINTSRGEVHDLEALVEAVESGKLSGVGLDVLKGENTLFNKKHEVITDPVYKRMMDLYPKFLITPHLGSSTAEAVRGMVEISLKNMDEYLLNGTCRNSLTK